MLMAESADLHMRAILSVWMKVCAELKEKGLSGSKEFRNTVLNRFYTFLDVATGNYRQGQRV